VPNSILHAIPKNKTLKRIHLQSSQPLGFVPCVDHLSSEELDYNKFYQNMKKQKKPKNNYIILYINTAMYALHNLPKIYSFIHSFLYVDILMNSHQQYLNTEYSTSTTTKKKTNFLKLKALINSRELYRFTV
jgi:uncharacterized protein YlbG (UPF0298 family)